MLGPFNSVPGSGISPQLLQMLLSAQGGVGSSGTPLANSAPSIPAMPASRNTIPFMPTMQGPQQPSDPASGFAPWAQLQQMQQQQAANKPQQFTPAGTGDPTQQTAGVGGNLWGTPATMPSAPTQPNPIVQWLLRQFGQPGGQS